MAKHSVSSRISRDVVNLLVDRGMTLTEIAGILGVTKSYISRVKAGTRKFTLDHLSLLEDALDVSLPVLLVEAIPRDLVKPELRRLHEMTLQLLRSTGSGARSTKRDATHKKRRVATKAA
jgi:transcriptional regulator with XRE-family HTH domain